MKRSVIALLFVLLLTALLPTPALAAEEGTKSVTYYASSRIRNGEKTVVSGEYLVFNEDGTGMAVYHRCAYSLSWSAGDGKLSFTDSNGKEFTGALNGDTLQGEFRGMEYTYRAGEDAPVIGLSPETWNRGLPFVTDRAELLTDGEEAELSAKAGELSEKYGCNVYIVTLDDLTHFSLSSSVETCAEEIRTGYGLGYGEEKNCVMLLLSMADRDYDLVAYGDFGNRSFTDYGKEYVSARFLDDFKDNRWADGFSDYVKQCGCLLELSSKGRPMDYGNRPVSPLLSILLSLLLSFAIALIVCFILKSGMKPTKEKTEAEGYVPPGGLNIAYCYDQYTHTTETRVYDPPKSSGSGGGGGGTSISSSGHSHSSGKF